MNQIINNFINFFVRRVKQVYEENVERVITRYFHFDGNSIQLYKISNVNVFYSFTETLQIR